VRDPLPRRMIRGVIVGNGLASQVSCRDTILSMTCGVTHLLPHCPHSQLLFSQSTPPRTFNTNHTALTLSS
jgi:hypothetical protein